MTSDIKYVELQDVSADVPYSTQIGPFGKALTPEDYTESGTPLLRGVNVNKGRFFDDGFVFVSDELADGMSKYLCSIHEVLMVHKGTIGPIGIIPAGSKHERYIMGNSMLRVIVDTKKMNPFFLFYWLQSPIPQWYLQARLSQVGVPQLQQPLTTFRKIPVPLFPRRIQDAITSVLDDIDSQIESIDNQNAILQQLCASLFKSWFIDFDPVKAKAEGRQPFGMDEETAALFPDSFEDSSLGHIPEGWKVCPLGEVTSLSRGLSYKADFLGEEGIPFHTANSVLEGGGYKFKGIKYYSGEFRKKHRTNTGDVIVATLEQSFDHALVGHVARIPSTFGEDGIYSGDLFKIQPSNNSISNNWLFSLLHSKYMHNIIIQYSNGTTINRIPQDSLKRPNIIIPPKEIIVIFDNSTKAFHHICDLNVLKTKKLQLLRNTLLPRLMSGELSVEGLED